MRTTATIFGNLRLTTGWLVLGTLVLLGLMLPVAWALKAVNVMAYAAPALSGADAAAHRKEQGLDPTLVAAVKTVHISTADRAGCGFVEQQKLNSADGGMSDAFGSAVALDGDTAVIGVPQDDVIATQDQGSAYVFVRSGATWQLQAQLFANDGAASDRFGQIVAISGNYIVIGAPQKKVNGADRRGAVYVFVRDGTAWAQQARLLANDGVVDDVFGWAVAISGDSIAVGAPGADIGFFEISQGAVYRFKRAGTLWTQEAKLTASDGLIGDVFGSAVAMEGRLLLVGAPGDDINANADQGAAYIFTSTTLAGEPVTLQRKLIANDGTPGDKLGDAVALSGSSALVGAPYDNDNRGAAYVFVPGSAQINPPWIQQAKLAFSQGGPSDFFGGAVAIKGDVAVIGVAQYANPGRGLVQVYTRNGTIWSQQPPLTAGDGQAGDRLGDAVALSGDTILAGARASGNVGAAYVFRNNCITTPLVSVSAASFGGAELAPASMVAAFGSNLTTSTQTAPAGMLPTQLAGVSVRVKDSLGADRLAPLFFAAPSQINYQMPPGMANGPATITVTNSADPVALGTATIASVAPSLFAANANGREVAAANALRVRANGTQQFEPVARYDTALSRFVATPIDLGPEGDQVFLVLYGTGLRFRSALSAVTANIGGVTSEALFAGAAPGFAGLDQINLRLPRALIGRGEVDVALTVDGKAANTVRINIR